ncbi:uncharacterized protein LOC130647391 isoform X3 [Hydractinia symbiolongicarpus]|uniref:uncharacterized protein LOC130647391 isoform X3 n=1 Tax=Hydractinia symbiolongicarpus TaxID=13093 RepID=UPI00254CABE7|nr:uncharacterized protein LOC130647391 isoform X3 [Hydractinia symbiolongicarpus]
MAAANTVSGTTATTVTNEEIVLFVKDRGYDTDVLDNIKKSRVCGDSMHLLNSQDFEEMGVGLADSRLLMQKFLYELKKDQLKSIVSSIRQGSSKRRVESKCKSSTISIEFSWQNFEKKGYKNKYSTVRIGQGGGLRRNKFTRDTLLSQVLEHLRSVFFPNGESKEHGSISLMRVTLIGTLNENIEDLSISLQTYIDKNSLKTIKFYLQTKSLSLALMEGIHSDSSGDDFEINNKVRRKESTSLVGYDVENISSDEQQKNGNSDAKERKQIIIEQDREYALLVAENFKKENQKASALKSLERRQLLIDQDEKFAQSLAKDKEKEKLKSDKENEVTLGQGNKLRLEGLVAEEPTLQEDCILLTVNHIERGRVQRLFLSCSKFQQVYIWIGSITESSRNFVLSFSPTTYIKPEELVTVADNKVVSMTWEIHAVFKLDDDTVAHSSKICCPVCGKQQSLKEIEAHTAACAENTYIDLIDENIIKTTMEEAENEEKALYEKTYCPATSNVLIDPCEIEIRLKEALVNLNVNTNGISLKVRRNHMFADFCKRFSRPWIREHLGSMIVVTFYGESGVDQGGLRREFFSDAMEEGRQQLFVESDDGYIPRINCYGDIANETFKLYGELMASSIAMTGPAPNYFAKWVYKYFIHGTKSIFDSGLKMTKDNKIGEVYYKLEKITDEKALQAMLSSDDGMDVLCEIGYKGIPQRAKMQDRDAILRLLKV